MHGNQGAKGSTEANESQSDVSRLCEAAKFSDDDNNNPTDWEDIKLNTE